MYDALPDLRGQLVLDLGCGPGDQAAELARRGAHVVGIDSNATVIEAARARQIDGAVFHQHDLRDLSALRLTADGIWCRFASAYFPSFAPVLATWAGALRAGGWIALTEIDDLFAHEPLSAETKQILRAYEADALASGRYDFHMGHKLEEFLSAAGFAIAQRFELGDDELAFDGPASPAVVEAWRKRLHRLHLKELAGVRFERLCDDFLHALTRADHRSTAKVYGILAVS